MNNYLHFTPALLQYVYINRILQISNLTHKFFNKLIKNTAENNIAPSVK